MRFSLRFAPHLLLLLLLTAPMAAQAQVRVGPRVGLNLARLRVPGQPARPLPGVQAGLAAHIRLTDHWSLQPALLYAQKGTRYRSTCTQPQDNAPTLTYQATTTLRIPYLELPLHLAYAPRWGRGFQAFAGPYVGVGLGGYLETDPEPVQLANGYVLERTRTPLSYPTLFGGAGTVRWHDVGLNLGLGYQHRRLLLQLQQSLGGTDVWLGSADAAEPGRSHRVTSFTLTYLLGRQ